MAESYTRVAPDSTGDKIATNEVTNTAGDTVERQQVVVADPVLASAVTRVDLSGALSTADQRVTVLMEAVLIELRIMNELLNDGLNTRANLDAMRNDYS